MEKGVNVALLAILVNLLLFVIKYSFSTLSGSIALKDREDTVEHALAQIGIHYA